MDAENAQQPGTQADEGLTLSVNTPKLTRTQTALELKQSLELSEAYRQSTTCVIWPTSSKAQAWDCVVAVVLTYTVIMTPFQVAFLLSTPTAIFVLNRIVDCILLGDMVLQMFMVYQKNETSSRSSGMWVTNIWKIRLNYLKKWFLLDAVGLCSSLVEIMDMASTSGVSTTRTARFVQAVRFLRLFRLARVLDRVKSATIQMAGKLPFQVGFFGGEFCAWIWKLVLIAHIAACAFGFVLTTEELEDSERGNWLKVVEAVKNLPIDRNQPMQLYLISLYWSFTILLTIGFGDITPQTLEEHIVVIFVMVMGGISWTLLMASACSLASAMDLERLHHGMHMETLIRMCTDHGLPKDLISRLLHFLVKSRRMELLAGQQALMSKMSPSLQSEVAVHVTQRFLRQVDFFSKSETGFTVALASSLRLQVFPPKEWIVPHELAAHVVVDEGNAGVERGFLEKQYCPHLTMLEGGIANLRHIRCSGSCWHQDLILHVESLRDQQVAQSIVFCSAYMLSREVLVATIHSKRFLTGSKYVRDAAIKLALKRTIIRAAQHAREHPCSLTVASARVLGLGHEDTVQREGVEKLRPEDLDYAPPSEATPPQAHLEHRLQDTLREMRRELRDQGRELRELKDRQGAVDLRLTQILSILSDLAGGNRNPGTDETVTWL